MSTEVTTTTRISTTTSTSAATDESSSSNLQDDKLRNGPCAKQYKNLRHCQVTKQVRDATNFQLCVSETDEIIRCVHKHPLFFHDTTKSAPQK
jgi:hypothetical protein